MIKMTMDDDLSLLDMADIDSLPMFDDGQDPYAEDQVPPLFTETEDDADDPLDNLFSIPVQDYLMRHETPDTIASSSEFLSKGRKMFGLSRREDSLRAFHRMLSQNEDLKLPPTKSGVDKGDRSPSESLNLKEAIYPVKPSAHTSMAIADSSEIQDSPKDNETRSSKRIMSSSIHESRPTRGSSKKRKKRLLRSDSEKTDNPPNAPNE